MTWLRFNRDFPVFVTAVLNFLTYEVSVTSPVGSDTFFGEWVREPQCLFLGSDSINAEVAFSTETALR